MTQAEFLQQIYLSDFLLRLSKAFENDTDQELKIKLWDAQEETDGRKIKAIKEEMNRRIRND